VPTDANKSSYNLTGKMALLEKRESDVVHTKSMGKKSKDYITYLVRRQKPDLYIFIKNTVLFVHYQFILWVCLSF
jgi:hypothetical protein